MLSWMRRIRDLQFPALIFDIMFWTFKLFMNKNKYSESFLDFEN